MSPRGIYRTLGLDFGVRIPVKTEKYRSEVSDFCRRSTSDDQSRSLPLVNLNYGYMQMLQMSFQETAVLQCVSIAPNRPDLSFRLVLGRRVLCASAMVSEKLVVLMRFSPSPVGRRQYLFSSGAIGLLPMGHGSYYLALSNSNQWLPIGEDGKKLSGKLDVSDEKKRGVVWGLPSFNKYWKGAWFFVGRDWGRNLPANREKSLSKTCIPRFFTQPGIFVIGQTYLRLYSAHCVSYHFLFKESSVVAGVDACDSEEEPLLRRPSAKGKGPAVQKEEGPPRSMGGDGAEVHMDVAGGSRGACSRVSRTREAFALSEIAGSPEATFAGDCVPDFRRRSTSDDQLRSLPLVDLHYGYMQMLQMSFQEAQSLFLTCLGSSGFVRVGDSFREARGTHEVLAVSGRPSPRPPFLWGHRIAPNGTRTHIFSLGAMLAIDDDVAVYGEILHITILYTENCNQ
ncbi:hypothetical protein ACOSQ3_027788 [Xanthoceras sorbifolium]